jgi:hypothetical protein
MQFLQTETPRIVLPDDHRMPSKLNSPIRKHSTHTQTSLAIDPQTSIKLTFISEGIPPSFQQSLSSRLHNESHRVSSDKGSSSRVNRGSAREDDDHKREYPVISSPYATPKHSKTGKFENPPYVHEDDLGQDEEGLSLPPHAHGAGPPISQDHGLADEHDTDSLGYNHPRGILRTPVRSRPPLPQRTPQHNGSTSHKHLKPSPLQSSYNHPHGYSSSTFSSTDHGAFFSAMSPIPRLSTSLSLDHSPSHSAQGDRERDRMNHLSMSALYNDSGSENEIQSEDYFQSTGGEIHPKKGAHIAPRVSPPLLMEHQETPLDALQQSYLNISDMHHFPQHSLEIKEGGGEASMQTMSLLETSTNTFSTYPGGGSRPSLRRGPATDDTRRPKEDPERYREKLTKPCLQMYYCTLRSDDINNPSVSSYLPICCFVKVEEGICARRSRWAE